MASAVFKTVEGSSAALVGSIPSLSAFLYLGEIVEVADTDILFNNPGQKQTEDYISGRFG